METPEDNSIKAAFQKVKQDMGLLTRQIFALKDELSGLREEMINICQIIKDISLKIEHIEQIEQKEPQIHQQMVPTHQQIRSTYPQTNPTVPTYNPTDNHPLKPLKAQNSVFSTGNEGVPTDRQTDQQTDNRWQKPAETAVFIPQNRQKGYISSPIEDAANILDSLDSLKKEIRLKFKQLTDQEIIVFSTLYQMEEDTGPVEYRALAQKLGLTESSIRDYIGRLLKKGIPVEKTKVNNKQILLGISPNLRKIASLSTILQLRDI